MVLKPSEPAYSASLRPIQDITAHISAFTTCATLFDGYGYTLAKDTRQLAKELCETVKALAQTFLVLLDPSSTSSGQGEEDHLVRTGAVHDTVERIRRTLPEDNFGAVKRRYTLDREMLEDSVNEVNAMIAGDEEDEDDPFGEDDEDDEWDELGFGSTKKLSETELDRVKKASLPPTGAIPDLILLCMAQIQPLIRILSLLHKRLLPDLIKPLSVSKNLTKLDIFPEISTTLLLALEEVVAVLYAPQNPSSISSTISTLGTTTNSIQNILLDEGVLATPASDVEALAKEVGEMTVGAQSGTKKEKDPAKWFDTCFAQISKLSKSISDAIDSEAIDI